MQKIIIGIETEPSAHSIIASSAASFDFEPAYRIRYDALEDMRRHLLAYAAVKNPDLKKAVGAVTYRTIEKLLLCNHVDTHDIDDLNIQIYLKPRYRMLNLELPVEIVRSHWIVTTARILLRDEIRENHVRSIRERRSSTSRRYLDL